MADYKLASAQLTGARSRAGHCVAAICSAPAAPCCAPAALALGGRFVRAPTALRAREERVRCLWADGAGRGRAAGGAGAIANPATAEKIKTTLTVKLETVGKRLGAWSQSVQGIWTAIHHAAHNHLGF